MRALAVALAVAGLIYHGPRTQPVVALTFDADMTPAMLAALRSGRQRTWYDEPVVRELEATRTSATIFLTGLWTQTYPRVVRRLARNPLFELENHTLDHAAWETPCYGLAQARDKRGELLRAAAIIERVAGVRPRYFRFPGGCENAADVALVHSLGEQPVQWDVVSGDAFLRGPAVVEREVLNGVRPGSIVVMHLVGPPRTPATAPALRAIIPALRARGYRFVTLDQLLGHQRHRIPCVSSHKPRSSSRCLKHKAG